MAGLIQVVDKNDKPIGAATNEEAWEKGLRHRVVRVMIYDKNGRVLLQHRSKDVKTWPNCWTCSASGHVDVGESYDEAAKREISEELGIKHLPFKEAGDEYIEVTWKNYHFRRFARYYTGRLDELPEHLQKSEVSSVRWFTIPELHRAIKENPENFTDGLIQTHKKLHK